MVVDGDGGQGRDIYAELHAFLHLGGEGRIEAVDALDEEYGALVKAQALAFVLAASQLEIVGGKFHLLAGEDGVQVAVELLEVEGV